MVQRIKRWSLYVAVCLGVCLGMSFLLILGVRHDSEEPGTVKQTSLDSDGLIHARKVDFASRFLPRCENLPIGFNSSSFKNMRKFTGRKMVSYTSVFPADQTKLSARRKHAEGNDIIPSKIVSNLKLLYQSAQTRRNAKIELTRVERTTLLSGPVIYYIETVGQFQSWKNSSYPASDSLIQHFVSIQHGALCCLSAFKVDLGRRVVVVATSKNLGQAWTQHFINEFSEILEKTNEQNFKIILTDFISKDVNVQQLFQNSRLRDRSKVILMNMPYNKPIGVETAVALIQNPEDIIFLCDFHLEIPLDFFTLIRKHVITGHMVFAPVVAKLDEGSSPQDKQGVWDYNGFGLLGISRADWDITGGINTRDFGDKWGGEDWDMIDRIVQSGLHVSRLRIPGLFHHYHSKVGMWPGGMVRLSDL